VVDDHRTTAPDARPDRAGGALRVSFGAQLEGNRARRDEKGESEEV